MKVFANYGVKFPHEKLDAKRLVKMNADLQNCVILVDEIHILFDSRDSFTKRNKMGSYFVLQTRKRNVVFFGTTQTYKQCEKRIRENADFIVRCERLKKKGVKTDWFRYRVYDGLSGAFVKKFQLQGSKYYGLYDTTEAITDFDL